MTGSMPEHSVPTRKMRTPSGDGGGDLFRAKLDWAGPKDPPSATALLAFASAVWRRRRRAADNDDSVVWFSAVRI